ncbi:hypothetical protein U9M48_027346, partial [Paspalum notatum var. saurae]
MDLEALADEEERQLQAHNEEEDARRALFGGTPPPRDGGSGTRTGSTSPPAMASVAAGPSNTRKRGPRSKVWDDFDKICHDIDGKKVRYAACCKYCKATLSVKSNCGTGHLLRHNCNAKKELERYLGFELSTTEDDEQQELSSILLHQRCACHIIILIVKCDLKRLKAYLDDFRIAINFLNLSNQKIAAYKSYCLSMGVSHRKFGVDVDVRWNSTYLMLKHLVPHRSTFSVFIQIQYPLSDDGSPLPTNDHWYVAKKATASAISELSSYLDSDTINQFDDSFNILSWWHQHKITFPILSILAKNVLIIPASTVSSESTFSLVGRVIEERRHKLTSDMVELAGKHLQHNLEKETTDLEAAVELMTLGDQGGGQGGGGQGR